MIQLKEAGMKVSIPDHLEHWYELVEHVNKALPLARVSYLAIWRKSFTAPKSKGWSDVLLMIKLLLTIPVSNAKLERIFSKLKCVKTNCC